MRTPLDSTEASANAIQRVKYSHDIIIDYMIANPVHTLEEIAENFGYTAAWLGRIRNSDAFNVVLARRRQELTDPTIVASAEENLRSVANRSMEKVLAKLEGVHSLGDAIKAMDVATRALGYGARMNDNNTNINFVVALPGMSNSAEEWVETYESNIQSKVR